MKDDCLVDRWLKKVVKRCCCKNSTVDPEMPPQKQNHRTKFLEAERNKPMLQDFTLGEYTEKVIQYGFAVVSNVILYVMLSSINKWMYRLA